MTAGRHGRDPVRESPSGVAGLVHRAEAVGRGLVEGLARRLPSRRNAGQPGQQNPYDPYAQPGAHPGYGAPDAYGAPRGAFAAGSGAVLAWIGEHRIVVGVVAVSVLLASYIVPAAASAGRLPSGVRVAGVDIGGLTHTEARTRLTRGLAGVAARPIKVTVGGRDFSLEPAETGLALDPAATVAAADDGVPSPAELVRSLFGTRTIAPRVRVDHGRLAQAVATVADAVDRPKREGAVRYQGLDPVAVLPKPGRVVDRAAAARQIGAHYLRSAAPLRLPTRVDAPTVTAAEVGQAVQTTARTAVAAPITLTNGPREAALTRRALAADLEFAADGKGGLRPRFETAEATARALARKLIDKAVAPRDATFEIVDDRPQLVPSRTGQGIDTARLDTAVAGVVGRQGVRSVPIQARTAPPRITTEQARTYGIEEKISSFTTRHPCCAPRVTNIHRIADLLDGYLVKPGETFSLNRVVGERDKARGFVAAPQILRGRFVDDIGGGISQFTTTMFNAVFFGGLQDVQHTPHQFYISRYPPGRESTVSFPNPDFRWRNDSPHGVLVKTAYTSTSITVSFWSTKRYDVESKSSKPYEVQDFETAKDTGKKCIPMEGAKGFSIDVWRIFKRAGETIKKQKIHTVYQPEPRLTCESKS